jgi:signal transduction histidine kinase
VWGIRFVPVNRIFRTVSFQLAALYSLIFALCFLALLLTTYWTTTAALRSQMQTEIQDQLNSLSGEAKTDGVQSIIDDIDERIAQGVNSDEYYFLSDATGKKLAGNLDNVVQVVGWHETTPLPESARRAARDPDEDHQLWAQGEVLADGSFLLVGQDAFRLLAALEAIVTTFAWLAGIAFTLAALAGLLVSRGFMRRIDDINTTSMAIMDGRLKERIPVRGTSDELDRLSGNLNKLFDSNQSLLESLKQVSANIAHDLRTPLARLRQGLEEAYNKRGNATAYKAAIESAISESDALLGTFSALLRIAQIESGSRKAGFKQVDVGNIMQRVADAYQAVAEDQGKVMERSVLHDAGFHGDGELLLQMFANLVENAIRHTAANTRIGLSLRQESGTLVAIVSDTGDGIAADQRDKVLEHFYRTEASRTTTGNGLGLALVAAITKLHGIAMALEDNGPGLRVVLKFPVQDLA